MADEAKTGKGAPGTEPRLTGVRYHAPSGRILLDLSNRVMLAVPVALVETLDGAETAALERVEIADDGHVLHWPALGGHLSYLGILTDILGARAHMTRLAGSAIARARERDRDGAAARPRRRR